MDPSPWSHAQSWLSSLERYAFPRIGKMPVSEVSSADVLEILAPIWQVKPDMAGKLRQHIRARARMGRGALPRGRRVTVALVAIILAARGVAGRQLPAPFWRQTTPMTEGTLTKVALVEQVA